MKAPGSRRAIAVAALVVFAIAVIVAVGGSGGSYRVHAVFEDVRGLIPGGEVLSGAEVVGKVDDVALGEDGLPVVTMTIEDSYQLRQGAFADIRLASNVGGVNRFVDLEQGDGEPLPEGATLGPEDLGRDFAGGTDQPVDLDLAVSDLDPRTRDEIAAILAAVDASVKGRGDDLGRAVRHGATALRETAALIGQVNSDQLAISTFVGQGRAVVGALARGPEDIGSAAESLAVALDIAAGRQVELARSARSLAPGLQGARRTLAVLGERIPAFEDIALVSGPAIRELAPTARAIEPAVGAFRPLLAEASALVAASPAQARVWKRVLAAVGPVVDRLGPLLEGAGPLVDYLRVWGPETVGFFTLWGDATANYDAAGNVARLGFGLIEPGVEPHANQIGPSDGPVPGLLRRPFHRTPGASEGEPWNQYWRSFIGGGERVEDLVVEP